MPWRPRSHSQRLGRAAQDTAYDTGQRATTPALALATKLRSSARWQRVRRLVLQRNPLCADPFGHHKEDGALVVAEEVDHIIGLDTRPDLAFDFENLQGICSPCHARKSACEHKG
jgi:5-methylcytosine-specific restriction endonuclease McrA